MDNKLNNNRTSLIKKDIEQQSFANSHMKLPPVELNIIKRMSSQLVIFKSTSNNGTKSPPRVFTIKEPAKLFHWTSSQLDSDP